MYISEELKDRFVKDYRLSIKLYKEPYFTERLVLYDRYFDTLGKWERFLNEVNKHNNEEEYFADYNRTKDNAINFIKATPAYQRFNEEDMNKFAVSKANSQFPHKDIYHQSNIGHCFISLDIKKANFNCLSQYDTSIFDNAETWEDFIKKFTTNECVIASKNVREIIMGQCNPSRVITYEKYYTDNILTGLLEDGIPAKNIVYFSNDEIVVDITDLEPTTAFALAAIRSPVPLRIEQFVLKGVRDTSNNKTLGYIREMSDGTYGFKCFNHYNLPLVLRLLNHEEVTNNDIVFEHEGILSKFIEIPKIEIV